MCKNHVLSHINLFAVLRNIEYLVEKDPETIKLVKNTNLAIQFNIKNGPKGNLAFKNGKAEMKTGKHKADIILFFISPGHFNRMIEGRANPIPLKGFTRLGFLTGTFARLADRLNFYLNADQENLKDKTFFKANTEMTAYTAFYALAEIGNIDQKGKQNAQRLQDGIIQIAIEDGIIIQIEVKDGKLTTKKGQQAEPRAMLTFANLNVAHDLLNGKLDSFSGIANGQLRIKGFIPMIENMNPILDQVAEYLT